MLPPKLSIINSLTIPSIVAQPGAIEADATVTWTNTLGITIGVTQILIWIGESGGAITDTPFHLINRTQNEPWVVNGQDHYGIPASVTANTWPLALVQGALYVFANDVIEFKVGLVNFNPTVAYGSAGATLYYLTP